MSDPTPPPGFAPLFRTSPFLETTGPYFHRKKDDGSFVIGLRVLPKHANGRGGAHGGLLMTLLDIALGYCSAFSETPPAKLTTASLAADFAGAPRVGDWIEAHVGGRLAFANAFLVVEGERVVRGSAVFTRNAPAADG